MTVRVLAFAGSARRESFNRKLIHQASQIAAEMGAAVTTLELRDYVIPLYDGDLEAEAGMPDGVKRIKEIFLSHHALLISSPEYNSSFSPLLKNVIDWVSRPVPGEAPLACYQGKVAGLFAASTGALGGIRGLVHVRSLLENINVIVVPEQAAIAKAQEAFSAEGLLKESSNVERVRKVVARVIDVAGRLNR